MKLINNLFKEFMITNYNKEYQTSNKMYKLAKKFILFYHDIIGYYKPVFEKISVSENALRTSKKIRGENRKPAIILNSVLPRSGSTFISNLIGLHHDICACPN